MSITLKAIPFAAALVALGASTDANAVERANYHCTNSASFNSKGLTSGWTRDCPGARHGFAGGFPRPVHPGPSHRGRTAVGKSF
jgi:hypothetical protein